MLDKDKIIGFGYLDARQLSDGTWVALLPLIFTTGLCYGLDDSGYEKRWCYESQGAAQYALDHWDGEGDPPGGWVDKRPE